MSTETPQKLPGIPDVPADQRTPAVLRLLEHCHRQQEELQALRDEVARLKGQGIWGYDRRRLIKDIFFRCRTGHCLIRKRRLRRQLI